MSDSNNVTPFPSRPQPLHLKVRDLANMEAALIALSQLQGLPTKTSYRLARLISKLKPDYAEFTTKKQELIDRYGTPVYQQDENEPDGLKKDANGAPVPSGNYNINDVPAFNKEFDGLLDEEVTIAGFKPFRIDDFEGAQGGIRPMDLVSIAPLLDPDEDI